MRTQSLVFSARTKIQSRSNRGSSSAAARLSDKHPENATRKRETASAIHQPNPLAPGSGPGRTTCVTHAYRSQQNDIMSAVTMSTIAVPVAKVRAGGDRARAIARERDRALLGFRTLKREKDAASHDTGAASRRLANRGLPHVLRFADLAACLGGTKEQRDTSIMHACTLARTNTSTCVVIVLGHALETPRSVPKAQNMCVREQARLRASEIACACSPADKLARTPCTHPRHGKPTKHTTASFPSQHGGNTHRRRHRKRPATPPPLPRCLSLATCSRVPMLLLLF